jgi:hypothetical protein
MNVCDGMPESDLASEEQNRMLQNNPSQGINLLPVCVSRTFVARSSEIHGRASSFNHSQLNRGLPDTIIL